MDELEISKCSKIMKDIELCSQSPEELLPLLKHLGNIDMTIELLRKSKIGVFTQKYKSHKDDRVQQ